MSAQFACFSGSLRGELRSSEEDRSTSADTVGVRVFVEQNEDAVEAAREFFAQYGIEATAGSEHEPTLDLEAAIRYEKDKGTAGTLIRGSIFTLIPWDYLGNSLEDAPDDIWRAGAAYWLIADVPLARIDIFEVLDQQPWVVEVRDTCYFTAGSET